MQSTIKNRTIFGRDNLEIMRGMDSNSIDLIYLDPPFNKKKEFTAPIGSSAEGASFKDWFRVEDVEDEWLWTIREDYDGIYKFLTNVKELNSLNANRRGKHYLYNYCYLTYLAIRLVEMRRILKDTGSIYLHCDPTMSHYLKILIDLTFGEKNFRNEIVWHYKKWSNVTRDFQKNHDVIFRYVKTQDFKFYKLYQNYSDEKWIEDTVRIRDKNNKLVRAKDKDGNYIKRDFKNKGVNMHDVFNDISWGATNKERTGYPTQKPLALIERIIEASSNEGDVILDPFCGCATTCVAAEKLRRQWIGIDVSVKAYELVKDRLAEEIDWKDSLFYEELVTYLHDVPKRTDLGKNYELKKYVYVISHEKYPGEFKVGIATNVQSRLNGYQTSDPNRDYEIEYKLLMVNFREVEKYIHKKFENKHEWVQGDLQEIIDSIKSASSWDLEKLHEKIEKLSG